VLVSLVSASGVRVDARLDFYMAPKIIPWSHWKMRLANDTVQFVIRPEASEMSLSFDYPSLCALEDLETGCRIFEVLRDNSGEWRMEAELPQLGMWRQRCAVPIIQPSEVLQRVLRGGKACLEVARQFGFRIEMEQVLFEEIDEVADRILALSGMLRSDAEPVAEASLVSSGSSGARVELASLQSTAFLCNFYIPLLDHVLVFVFMIEGRPEYDDADPKVRIKTKGPVTHVKSTRISRREFKTEGPAFLRDVVREQEAQPGRVVFPAWQKTGGAADVTRAGPSEESEPGR
jgi:hypothetical protein